MRRREYVRRITARCGLFFFIDRVPQLRNWPTFVRISHGPISTIVLLAGISSALYDMIHMCYRCSLYLLYRRPWLKVRRAEVSLFSRSGAWVLYSYTTNRIEIVSTIFDYHMYHASEGMRCTVLWLASHASNQKRPWRARKDRSRSMFADKLLE